MNFITNLVEAVPGERRALISIEASGKRNTWTFGEIAQLTQRTSALFAARGVRRGDVVMTLVGSRIEWVVSMLACFRIGAIAFPSNEQLRANDLRERITLVAPSLIIADDRNRSELEQANPSCPVMLIQELRCTDSPPPPANLAPTDPALIVFTSGTSGKPKAVVHPQSYLTGQMLQATHWLGATAKDLVWCTAATGWSKSSRNTFIAPWLRGAAALIHDARFDPQERFDMIEREGVTVLCMSPTEYRQMAKRITLRPIPSLRRVVSAGEALTPWAIEAWGEVTPTPIADGFGQTETGHLTGPPLGVTVDGASSNAPNSAAIAERSPNLTPPGSMGKPLPGINVAIDDGELVVDPQTIPTFFSHYFGAKPDPDIKTQLWRTGDLVTQDDDGFLFYEGRNDDLIISSGYRIGPTEVESALLSHPAVAEAAVIAHPDDERGSLVKAVIVPNNGFTPSDALAKDLQTHVKLQTAPYKYPRIVEFTLNLPKTQSGKVRHAALRQQQ